MSISQPIESILAFSFPANQGVVDQGQINVNRLQKGTFAQRRCSNSMMMLENDIRKNNLIVLQVMRKVNMASFLRLASLPSSCLFISFNLRCQLSSPDSQTPQSPRKSFFKVIENVKECCDEFIIISMTNISNLNLSKGTIPPLLKYKIVFLGDQAVGKSSIINRFIYDIFDGNEHRPTIGIDFISQNIFLEDKTIRLQLWDTAGQQRFKALIPNYIRDTSVAVIVYDITNRNTFKSVQKWIDDVKNQRGEGVIIALLANKVDLEDRDVTQAEGKQTAERNMVLFKQVSAKTGANIQQFFKEIAALLPEVNQSTSRSKTQQPSTKQEATKVQETIVLTKPVQPVRGNTEKKKGCC